MTATRVSGLVVTAVINISLEILCFALFSVFRKQPSNANIYFARHVVNDKEKLKRGEGGGFVLKNYLPSAGWVKKAWEVTDDEIVNTSGLDSLVFLRIYVFCLRFFGICTIFGLFVLVPVNYVYGEIDIDTIASDTLDQFTISNITDGSNRLWVHFGLLYCISFAAYFLLYWEYRYISKKRISYLRSTRSEPDQFTVLLRAIPKSSEKTYSEQVETFFQTYYPDTYLKQSIVYADASWEKRLNEFKWLSNEVQFLRALPPTERTPEKNGHLGLFGKKEDPLNFYLQRLEALYKEIRQIQKKFMQSKQEIPVSFVSFKTHWGATVASQTMQIPNPLKWVTEWAPEPRDVNWTSLSMGLTHTWMARLVIGTIFFCITVLYFIPSGLVYSLATLSNLMTWFPFAETLLSISIVGSLINGYLPSLLLAILYYFIPTVMLFLTTFEGYPSKSMQERRTCGKVYLFIVANSFFLVTYGTLINLLSQAIESPREIPALLASAVASQANFFMNFVMTRGWTGYAVEILEPYLLFKGFVWRHVFGRRQYGPYTNSLLYYRSLPNFLLFIFIGFIYAVIAPLMLPFLMIYFVAGYIVYRNQIYNRYEPAYETGGQYWPHVHNRIIFSLLMMQIVCIGMFGVKNKAMASTLSLPLPLVTVLFNVYCSLRFYPVFGDISVEMAVSKDREIDEKGTRDIILERLKFAYTCPLLQRVNTDELSADKRYEPLLSPQSNA